MTFVDRTHAWLERLWYQPRGAAFAALTPLLGPATLVTLAASALRRRRLPARSSFPVLAVGNLVVGGSGKTQVVLALAARAQKAGLRPGVVSRGHGGTQVTAARVLVSSDPARFGDEPVLLARRLPEAAVIVARDRAEGVALAASSGCDFAILDDGLQQTAVRPRQRIALFGAEAPLGNQALLPLGPLRDPPSALWPDDLVWLHGEGDGFELPRVDVRSRTRALGLVPLAALETNPRPLSGARVFAFAGIARPERFFATLRSAGALVAGSARFADHRRYAEAELRGLVTRAQALDAGCLVCTEKDAVRLGELRLALPVYALRTELVVLAGEEHLDPLLRALVGARMDSKG